MLIKKQFKSSKSNQACLTLILFTLYIVEVDASRSTLTVCLPGHYYAAAIEECVVCPAGQFNTEYGRAIECAACRTECGRYAHKISLCTSTSDMRCECDKGWFQKTQEDACTRHQSCDITMGFYLISNGTSTSDVDCGIIPTESVIDHRNRTITGPVVSWLNDIGTQNGISGSYVILGVVFVIVVVIVVVIVICVLIKRYFDRKRQENFKQVEQNPRLQNYCSRQNITEQAQRLVPGSVNSSSQCVLNDLDLRETSSCGSQSVSTEDCLAATRQSYLCSGLDD